MSYKEMHNENKMKPMTIESFLVDMNDTTVVKNPENVIIAIDVSGSTSTYLASTSMTVLEKEMDYVRQYVLENPRNTYFLYTFESNAKYHGNIRVLESENFVQLPDLVPLGATCTHTVFDCIKTHHNRNTPINRIILITDGQTDSNKQTLIGVITRLKASFNNDIKLDIVAISTSCSNLEIGDDNRIPGIDLLNLLGNEVNAFMIYSKFYTDTPFTGSMNSAVDKTNIKFLGVRVKGNLIEFINTLLQNVNENKQELYWGENDTLLKKTLCELGKILSLLFVALPESHKLHPLIVKIQSTFENTAYSKERVYNIVEYGFKCAKGRTQIILTDFEQHVKESCVKKSEFKDAVRSLQEIGTVLNASMAVSLPTASNPVCCISEQLDTIRNKFDVYPNSMDDSGNVYFGLDVSPQAIRIALRTFWAVRMGYKDSRGTAPMFLVANTMSMMFVSGIDMNSQHMKCLRRLAICQASMSVLVSHDKYDDKGCFYHWKNGSLIPLHYNDTKTHVSLYSDERINFLKLPQSLWWALMMSMLGIFDEQLVHYEQSFTGYGIEPNESAFLHYIRTNYHDKITNSFILDKVSTRKISVFSLDDFDEHDKVYRFKDHGECVADTWYSENEINDYVKTNGCVWCHQIPLDSQLELVEIDRPRRTKHARSLIVGKSANDDECFQCRRFRITFIGITGSGKSTFAEKITKKIVGDLNGLVLNINADRLSKQGLHGKQMTFEVKNSFDEFEMMDSRLKVILIDLCNVNTSTDRIFGLDLTGYTNIDFYPNMCVDRFREYEMWCLNNVLSRGMWTLDTLYWLTPVTVGVDKCIGIHNNKASALANKLNVKRCPVKNADNILEYIKPESDSYKSYVDSIDVDAQIEQLLTPMIHNDA